VTSPKILRLRFHTATPAVLLFAESREHTHPRARYCDRNYYYYSPEREVNQFHSKSCALP
jgi:hypothetical protein